jgi:hypothetical protein
MLIPKLLLMDNKYDMCDESFNHVCCKTGYPVKFMLTLGPGLRVQKCGELMQEGEQVPSNSTLKSSLRYAP